MQGRCLEPAATLRASLHGGVQRASGKWSGHKGGAGSAPGKASQCLEQFKGRFRNRLLRKGYVNAAGCPRVGCLHLGQLPWAPCAVRRDPAAAAHGAQGTLSLLEAPSLETFQTRLDGALSSLVELKIPLG